ncbi:hypothetical protein H6775_02470 [Candidatus Nomurabacteria bacterium]|nr:hypothetical protein [Candidatus Nomurabacteria bacterium]
MKGNKKTNSGLTLVEGLVIMAVTFTIVAIVIANIKYNDNSFMEDQVRDTVSQALREDNLSFVALAGAPQMSEKPEDLRKVLRELSLGAWVEISEKAPRGNYPEWDPKQMVLRHWQLALTAEDIEDIVNHGNLLICDGLILRKTKYEDEGRPSSTEP